MTYELTSLTPRPYQRRATEWALQAKQGVVCLPTGTGKTLVGCQWACTVLEDADVDRVLVLAPSRFLVAQTHAYYETHTSIPTTKLDGTTPPADRRSRWTDGRVVVTTPHTAVNDTAYHRFDAVIIDECHHTTGRHACAQLLDATSFDSALGLSATIPADREREITAAIGPVRRRSWTDLPDDHVPDWLGHVSDTPYPASYRDVVTALETARHDLAGTQLAGLPSLGIRMLCRDGALALSETLSNATTMADVLGERVTPHLADCPPLHKLDACRAALNDYDFEKAVLFVDRVAIANRLADALDEYTTVTLVGRLHASHAQQEAALEAASEEDTDLIITTAAGEEGLDLPAADLLIVWSNVVSAVRFIQRLGRIMRPSDTDAPRNAVYLASPDSPDYEALRRGVAAAHRAGLDITHIDPDALLDRSVIGRVHDILEGTPRQRTAIADTLNQPDSKVDRWLRTAVRDGDTFYLYCVPDTLTTWRNAARGVAAWVGADTPDLDEQRANRSAEALRNTFSPGKSDRYYLREADIPLLTTDHSRLIDGPGTHRLSISYGPSHTARGAHHATGTPETLADTVTDTLGDADSFYATISYEHVSPRFSFQMQYQGSVTEQVVTTVAANADAIAATLTGRLDAEL